MLIAVLAASLLLAQAAAPATTAPAAAAPATASEAKAAKAQKAKLICTSEKEIGSVTPRRVCRTPERVEAERRAAERVGDYLRDK